MKYNQPFGVSDADAPYVNGDPSIGRRGSIPPAAIFENPQRELVALIEAAGFTASDEDLAQVLAAVRAQPNYALATNTGSGDQDALVVEFDPPISVFKNGMPLRVKAVQNNTGAATLTADGQTFPIIRANGADLEADDIEAGSVVDLLFDGTHWQIANYKGVSAETTNNNSYVTEIPYIADSSGAANTITAVYSPAITVLTAGMFIAVKLAHDVTGATTIGVNALSAKNVVRPNGSALQAGDAVTGQMLLLSYDGTKFQLVAAAASSGAQFVPGCVYLVFEETPPAGTLELDGSLVSTTTYSRVYDKWGYKFGGSGGLMKLPDTRGEFIRLWDHGRGADPDAAARTSRGDGTTGDHVGTKQANGVGAVNLSGIARLRNTSIIGTWTGPDVGIGGLTFGIGRVDDGGLNAYLSYGSYATVDLQGTISGLLSGGSNETRPRNITMMAVVAY